jgi:hypothetical protein
MKINYTNTALKILENQNEFNFHLPQEIVPEMSEKEAQDFGYSVLEAFKNSGLSKEFKKNIQYVTQPFYEAYHKSQIKIKEIVMKEKFDEAGTLIIPWPTHTQTIFYYINTDTEQEEWVYEIMMVMFTKSPKLKTPGLDLFVSVNKKDKSVKEFIWKGFVDQGRDSSWFLADLILFKTFLKYAEPETKIVNGLKKEKHCGQKYLNETNRSIEILDSTYFTTICRTEGFGVSGHFRWQPYGPKMSNKRLQWISEYQKQGYTRKAKILR